MSAGDPFDGPDLDGPGFDEPGFDEARLADADQVATGDRTGLLWSLATAGAQVRHAIAAAAENGAVGRLRGHGPPRAVLVATDVPPVARVLGALGGAAAPITTWRGADLPRWAGASDALLVAAADGDHPRLAALTEQAARRGLLLAVVSAPGSPVDVAAGRQPTLPFGSGELHPRALRWAALTPLLVAADALEILTAPTGVLHEVASALDHVAETCRPGVEPFLNPAKSLAGSFAAAYPVVTGAGALAGLAARQIAQSLQLFAGRAAVGLGLPEGLATASALLANGRGGPGGSGDDFFRDRTEPEADHPHLLVVGDDGDPDDPLLADGRSRAALQLDELAARQAAGSLRRLAAEHVVAVSEVAVPDGVPLARYAAATAFGDFTAAYLAIGMGVDPGRAQPGEQIRVAGARSRP